MLTDEEALFGSSIKVVYTFKSTHIIDIVACIVEYVVGSSCSYLGIRLARIELRLGIGIVVYAVIYDAQAFVVGELQFEE